MKYIRTKDRVFETHRLPIERFSIELTKIIDKQVGLPNPHIEEIKIINQADTIEELCDEFVVVSSLCCSLLNENEKQDIKRFAKSNLFGAIWTDKGLIYVAKMNEKGELQLI